ncbi:hypothetical protein [Botrimarina hoheduenensis]|nr:hypothetical protein [Botrimarina hoheduenensis]
MNRTLAALTLALSWIVTTPAAASSAGGSLYRPRPVVQASASMPCQTCQSGKPCSTCPLTRVDPPSPPACSVDGVCRSKADTFGFYQTNWRRWPSDVDSDTPKPAANPEDALLGPFDPPPAKEEDQQAPPPIEEPSDEQDAPVREIELPAPSAPNTDGPPTLPFGATTPRLPVRGQQYRLPEASSPAMSLPSAAIAKTNRKPNQQANQDLPQLPPSLARTPATEMLRRLPALDSSGSARDSAILPASYREAQQAGSGVVNP